MPVAPVAAQGGRHQYALGLALLAERHNSEQLGLAGGGWRVASILRLAGHSSGPRDSRALSALGVSCYIQGGRAVEGEVDGAHSTLQN